MIAREGTGGLQPRIEDQISRVLAQSMEVYDGFESYWNLRDKVVGIGAELKSLSRYTNRDFAGAQRAQFQALRKYKISDVLRIEVYPIFDGVSIRLDVYGVPERDDKPWLHHSAQWDRAVRRGPRAAGRSAGRRRALSRDRAVRHEGHRAHRRIARPDRRRERPDHARRLREPQRAPGRAACQTVSLIAPSGVSAGAAWSAQLDKHGLRAVSRDADVTVRIEAHRAVVNDGFDSFGSAISHVVVTYTVDVGIQGGAPVRRHGELAEALDGALAETLPRASTVEIRAEPAAARIEVDEPRVATGTGSVMLRCIDGGAKVRGRATADASDRSFEFATAGSPRYVVRLDARPAANAGSGPGSGMGAGSTSGPGPIPGRPATGDASSAAWFVGLVLGGLALTGLAVVWLRRGVQLQPAAEPVAGRRGEPPEAAPAPPAERTAHTVLFLAANPIDANRLALDREARAIQVELERARHGDSFELVTRWAAQPHDLLRELVRLKPMVVHFSGHGTGQAGVEQPDRSARRDVVDATAGGAPRPAGLVFQDEDGRTHVVSSEAVNDTLGAAGSSVRLVVLNACYSEVQASALLAHVDCVVGMTGAIGDDAARSFAIGFYGGLGQREPVAAAFRQGCAAIRLVGLPDGDRPQLRVRDGVDAERLVLAARAPAAVPPAA